MYFDFPVEIRIQIVNCARSLIFQRKITKYVLFLVSRVYHLYKIILRRSGLKAMNTTPAKSSERRHCWEDERGKE